MEPLMVRSARFTPPIRLKINQMLYNTLINIKDTASPRYWRAEEIRYSGIVAEVFIANPRDYYPYFCEAETWLL